MGRNSRWYWPSALVWAVRVRLVPRFLAITCAPGTTAPLRSVTMPYKVVLVCAARNGAAMRQSNTTNQHNTNFLVILTSGAPWRRTQIGPLILKLSLIENGRGVNQNVT